MDRKPYIREMLKEAVEKLGGRAPYPKIRSYIEEKYGDVKTSSINAHITACTVNNQSRIHYQQNKKPRQANSNYDFLYRVDRGIVELYDLEKHGTWEIRKDEDGILSIGRLGISDDNDTDELIEDEIEQQLFPVENNLRDFIAKNISTIRVNNKKLELFIDENGRNGVEYPTGEVGYIDILAIDEDKNFIVIELKLSRGPDRALGQLQRYMGWVKMKLAGSNEVRGIIVAKDISQKLKYAASVTTNISLYEYQLDFKIQPINI